MARKVFFSFHYERDSQRAAQVRNADLLADEDEYGVIDAVDWEKIERDGEDAIKRWIQSQLEGTSVTIVLIGAETADRPWVQYEIRESWKRGNAIIGVRIHNVKNLDGKTDQAGTNPFEIMKFTDGTATSSAIKTYDWVSDDGRSNMGEWVEAAFNDRKEMTEPKEMQEGLVNADKAASSFPRTLGTKPAVIQRPPQPWAM